MSKKTKILLLFPDGVGIRNYLYSDVFKNSANELVLFHNFDAETEQDIKARTGLSQAVRIPQYKESLKEKFLRELICLSRLHYNTEKTNNPTILTNWNSNQKGFLKKLVYKTIEVIAPFTHKYGAILKLEKNYQKAIRQNPFYVQVKKIMLEVQPDRLFCSHQRALQAPVIFAAAIDLGIPTTTVIFSWDNLPKARMALRADQYLVWSEYMKKELQLYYPEISESSIHITGTPQFEFYGTPEFVIEKGEFYNRYNLDSDRKIICYSGDDEKTSPDDPLYLSDLADELIKSGLDKQYQILLRRCPVDLSGRFDTVVQRYEGLIKEAPPLWLFKSSQEWSSVYPSYEDVALLVSTVFYSNIVVNVGSTMAFDFGMLNKPCIFINYDQKIQKVPGWSVKTIYNYQHFRSMPSNDAVLWLNHPSDVSHLLSVTNSGASMKRWEELVVGLPQGTSKLIQDKLK